MRVAPKALSTRDAKPTGCRNRNEKEESKTAYINARVRSSMGS